MDNTPRKSVGCKTLKGSVEILRGVALQVEIHRIRYFLDFIMKDYEIYGKMKQALGYCSALVYHPTSNFQYNLSNNKYKLYSSISTVLLIQGLLLLNLAKLRLIFELTAPSI